MRGEPPNFNGDYPLAGARIGPAWREMWSTLSQDEWARGDSLAEEVARRHDLKIGTVLNLLRKARQVGLIEVQYRPEGSGRQGSRRPPAWYRIPKEGREPGITGSLPSLRGARRWTKSSNPQSGDRGQSGS